MSNTIMEKITVESITQFGVRAGGKSYSISPRLKEKGVEPNNFSVGQQYEIELYIGPKGGRSINSFNLIGGLSVSQLPPVPSLPSTTTKETIAPKGVAPVAPAAKKVEVADSEKMTKKDWANKDRTIELQAIMKSTLESPMVAQLAVGKRIEEVLQTVKAVYEFSLALYDAKK